MILGQLTMGAHQTKNAPLFRHSSNYLHCGYVNIGAMSSVCSFQNAFSKFSMEYFASVLSYFDNKITIDWYSQNHWKIRKESFSKGKIDVSNTLEKRFLFLGFPIIWTGNTAGSQIADNFPKWVPFTPNPQQQYIRKPFPHTKKGFFSKTAGEGPQPWYRIPELKFIWRLPHLWIEPGERRM